MHLEKALMVTTVLEKPLSKGIDFRKGGGVAETPLVITIFYPQSPEVLSKEGKL